MILKSSFCFNDRKHVKQTCVELNEPVSGDWESPKIKKNLDDTDPKPG